MYPGRVIRGFTRLPAPVARDIFRQGSVSLSTTERVVSIIKSYQKSLAELGMFDAAGVRAVERDNAVRLLPRLAAL